MSESSSSPGSFAWSPVVRPFQRLYFSLGLALHPYSMYFGVYFAVFGWDVLTHFVSGTLLAGGLYLLFVGLRGATGRSVAASRAVHVLALLGVLAGALLWEAYEVIAPWLTVYGPLDTVKDVLIAAVAWGVVARFHSRLLAGLPDGVADRVGALFGERT